MLEKRIPPLILVLIVGAAMWGVSGVWLGVTRNCVFCALYESLPDHS